MHANAVETTKKKKKHFRNSSTIKGVNFFGLHSEFIMSGSDCGNLFIWDKNTEAIVQWKHGDDGGVVNCLEGHPKFPIIATSGLDSDIKIWYPNKPDGVSFGSTSACQIDYLVFRTFPYHCRNPISLI